MAGILMQTPKGYMERDNLGFAGQYSGEPGCFPIELDKTM